METSLRSYYNETTRIADGYRARPHPACLARHRSHRLQRDRSERSLQDHLGPSSLLDPLRALSRRNRPATLLRSRLRANPTTPCCGTSGPRSLSMAIGPCTTTYRSFSKHSSLTSLAILSRAVTRPSAVTPSSPIVLLLVASAANWTSGCGGPRAKRSSHARTPRIS